LGKDGNGVTQNIGKIKYEYDDQERITIRPGTSENETTQEYDVVESPPEESSSESDNGDGSVDPIDNPEAFKCPDCDKEKKAVEDQQKEVDKLKQARNKLVAQITAAAVTSHIADKVAQVADQALDNFRNPRSSTSSEGVTRDSSDLAAQRFASGQAWDAYQNGDMTANELEDFWKNFDEADLAQARKDLEAKLEVDKAAADKIKKEAKDKLGKQKKQLENLDKNIQKNQNKLKEFKKALEDCLKKCKKGEKKSFIDSFFDIFFGPDLAPVNNVKLLEQVEEARTFPPVEISFPDGIRLTKLPKGDFQVDSFFDVFTEINLPDNPKDVSLEDKKKIEAEILPPLPVGFFGEPNEDGSEEIDTIMRRAHEEAPNGGGAVPIELVELSLTGVEPIVVGGGAGGLDWLFPPELIELPAGDSESEAENAPKHDEKPVVLEPKVCPRCQETLDALNKKKPEALQLKTAVALLETKVKKLDNGIQKAEERVTDLEAALDRMENPANWAESEGRRTDSADLEARRQAFADAWGKYKTEQMTAQDLENYWENFSDDQRDDWKDKIKKDLKQKIKKAKEIVQKLKKEKEAAEKSLEQAKQKQKECENKIAKLEKDLAECLKKCAKGDTEIGLLEGIGRWFEGIFENPPLVGTPRAEEVVKDAVNDAVTPVLLLPPSAADMAPEDNEVQGEIFGDIRLELQEDGTIKVIANIPEGEALDVFLPAPSVRRNNDGSLVVSNIGSSGQAGVSIDLDHSTLGQDLINTNPTGRDLLVEPIPTGDKDFEAFSPDFQGFQIGINYGRGQDPDLPIIGIGPEGGAINPFGQIFEDGLRALNPEDVPDYGDYNGDGRPDPDGFDDGDLGDSDRDIDTGRLFGDRDPGTGPGNFVPFGSGDYDGDGQTDPSVFRPEGDLPLILPDGFGPPVRGVLLPPVGFDPIVDIGRGLGGRGVFEIDPHGDLIIGGLGEDVPVPGDYDGDGQADPPVFRPSTRDFTILGESAQGFGVEADPFLDYVGNFLTSGTPILAEGTNPGNRVNFFPEIDLSLPGDLPGEAGAPPVHTNPPGRRVVIIIIIRRTHIAPPIFVDDFTPDVPFGSIELGVGYDGEPGTGDLSFDPSGFGETDVGVSLDDGSGYTEEGGVLIDNDDGSDFFPDGPPSTGEIFEDGFESGDTTIWDEDEKEPPLVFIEEKDEIEKILEDFPPDPIDTEEKEEDQSKDAFGACKAGEFTNSSCVPADSNKSICEFNQKCVPTGPGSKCFECIGVPPEHFSKCIGYPGKFTVNDCGGTCDTNQECKSSRDDCFACVDVEEEINHCRQGEFKNSNCDNNCDSNQECEQTVSVTHACYTCKDKPPAQCPNNTFPGGSCGGTCDSGQACSPTASVGSGGNEFACFGCVDLPPEPPSCEDLCSQNGFSATPIDFTSDVESQLNSVSCVSSYSMQIQKAMVGDCECHSTSAPTITFDMTPPVCVGTVCGDVQCNDSVSCSTGENTTTTVTCNWGGWQKEAQYQYSPKVGN
jgi:predicted  nucleic acid-binding Zn-ribbon protein